MELVILALFVLVTILFASNISLITVIKFKLKKHTKTEDIYLFSNELFEAEYANSSHWHYSNEQYKKKKLEEFSKQLP